MRRRHFVSLAFATLLGMSSDVALRAVPAERTGASPAKKLQAPASPDPVAQVAQTWAKDWSTKNVEHILTLYAPDAVFMSSENPRVVGREAIAAFFRKAASAANATISMQSSVHESSGDLAYDQGTYSEEIHFLDANGAVTSTRHAGGSYLIVLRRVNGQWLIVQQMWTEESAAK
ncbi:MAG: YybH family protein [Candidatus Acidiferrales bacterium]